MPAIALSAVTGVSLSEVRMAYQFLQEDEDVSRFVDSLFYPYRLRWKFAETTASAWVSDPLTLERIATGIPVLSKTVEIHPSRGTCSYSCAMCLWSDKQSLTYKAKGLTGDGLLTLQDWTSVLRDLREGGVTTLVVSGGGEALLNADLVLIIETASSLGFRVQIYTSGFDLSRVDPRLWEVLVGLDQIRFSIHSPVADIYNTITGMPARINALDHVVRHIKRLREMRDRLETHLRIGIGFVIQPLNYAQVGLMADFAAEIPVDFIHIRKDEVGVTDKLSLDRLAAVRDQILSIRDKSVEGGFGGTLVDFSDELVSLANGQTPVRAHSQECLAKYFRPTISPFGVMTPCDLKAEPRFASTTFNLGRVTQVRIPEIVKSLAETVIPDACAQCMPSSRTGNAVYTKLIKDYMDGFGPDEQPFYSPSNQ